MRADTSEPTTSRNIVDAEPDTGLDPLMSAVISILADLETDTVLDRLVAAGRDLTHAANGAVDVLGSHGELRTVVRRGVDAQTLSRIVPLPRGRGVVARPASEPQPLPLHELSDRRSPVGFPPHQPAMRTYLSVPVRVRGAAFGTLSLTDPVVGDTFTAHDEQVADALAAVAGIALEHARQYELSRRHAQWLETAAACTLALTSGRAHADAVAEVVELVRARTSATVVQLREETGPPPAVGPDRVPTVRRLIDGSELGVPGGTWVLHVPLGTGDRSVGSLELGWPAGDRQTRRMYDVSSIADFGEQLTLALDVARRQSDRARVAVFAERERVARELQDMVIQRLFAIGLHVQAAAQDAPVDAAHLLDTVVNELDETIKEVRTSIFQQRSRGAEGPGELEARIDAEMVAAHRGLGFIPRLRVDGVTAGVPPDLAEDVVAVIREALSNIARHARARDAGVRVEVGADLAVEVNDNGIGIPAETTRRSGLANLADRALRRGGAMTVTSRPDGGSLVRWSVPLR